MSTYQTNTEHHFSDELFIFERMAEGDQRALRFFFDKYYDNLCNYVNIYVRSKSVSEDIVQDIFIYFWEKRGIIRMETSVKSYLFRASRNKYLNYLRNEKCHQAIRDEVNANSVTFVNPDDNLMDSIKLEEIINASIENLPPRCREVYLFHKNEDLSYKEIAYRMDIAEKTVENQMTIAHKKLKEYLAPYYDQIFVLVLIGLFENIG
ncbi:MAG TPA: RNA polymerase sigma-70 factor [Paludibacter sp.]